jgi:hypothetical protein
MPVSRQFGIGGHVEASPLVVDRIGFVSYAAVRGAGCFRPGRGAVLRQRRGPRSRACWECTLGRAGNGNAGCLAARAADGFCEWLGRAECGGSQMGVRGLIKASGR